jgi:hypothetical protein
MMGTFYNVNIPYSQKIDLYQRLCARSHAQYDTVMLWTYEYTHPSRRLLTPPEQNKD